MLALLIFSVLVLQSAAQTEYTIQFNRSRDTITLECSHRTSGDLQVNDTIRYWLNRTDSVRPTSDFQDDLMDRLGFGLVLSDPPESVRPAATFRLTHDLEGRYTCGKIISGNNIDESDPVYLISLEREGLRPSKALAAQSGETVTLSCPFEVGKLSGCYFGRWLKNTTKIIEILSPGPHCEDIQAIDTLESAKYSLDRSTFSLTVTNVMATDSDIYVCDLSLVNPAVPTGQTVTIAKAPFPTITLSVDVAPIITDGPENVIVGMDNTTEELLRSATFACTAVGLPTPTITWIYTASLSGEVQNLDGIAETRTINLGEVQNGTYNGRQRVRSTIILSITPTDGGTMTCQTGSHRSAAQLTVLSPPSSIEVFRSCDGNELFYEVNLQVPLNRLTALEFSYINGDNEITRVSDMEFSGTNQIYYREDRSELTIPNYRIRIALIITTGNHVNKGPSFTSTQTINSKELSEGAKIGLSAGAGAFVFGLMLTPCVVGCVMCLVLACCKIKGHTKTARKAVRDLETMGINHTDNTELFQNRINDLKEAINKIERCLRLRFDGSSGHNLDTEGLLEDVKQAKEILDAVSAMCTSVSEQTDAQDPQASNEDTKV